jgi:hypothetical protein
MSCSRHEKFVNYKVQITYSSFFTCGDYQKILVDNKWSEDALYKSKIKDFNIYTFNINGNCSDSARVDTLSAKLSIEQSDNIFYLANNFVNQFQVYNPVLKEPGKINLDGSDIKVEVCHENKCKSVTVYHYDDLSQDLRKLLSFISSIN